MLMLVLELKLLGDGVCVFDYLIAWGMCVLEPERERSFHTIMYECV